MNNYIKKIWRIALKKYEQLYQKDMNSVEENQGLIFYEFLSP